MELPNDFWIRHFLICNQLAKEVCSSFGWHIPNFAKLIFEETENGRFGNNQMTKHFWSIDRILCELHESDSNCVFEMIEEEEITLEQLANLTEDEIGKYYNDYCIGKFKYKL